MTRISSAAPSPLLWLVPRVRRGFREKVLFQYSGFASPQRHPFAGPSCRGREQILCPPVRAPGPGGRHQGATPTPETRRRAKTQRADCLPLPFVSKKGVKPVKVTDSRGLGSKRGLRKKTKCPVRTMALSGGAPVALRRPALRRATSSRSITPYAGRETIPGRRRCTVPQTLIQCKPDHGPPRA